MTRAPQQAERGSCARVDAGDERSVGTIDERSGRAFCEGLEFISVAAGLA